MRYTTFLQQSELIFNRLDTIKGQITALAAHESLSDHQRAKVKVLSVTANTKHAEFEKLVTKLYNSSTLPEDIDNKEVVKVQSAISECIVSIQTDVTVLLPPTNETADQSSLNISQSQANASSPFVNLPKLNLPTFAGQPQNWVSFHSLFESTIHKNDNISNVEKFSYLLSCLSGEPLDLIKSLPLTNANYLIAWQSILKRYHNSRLLITLHVNNILDLPETNALAVKNLRIFLSAYNENAQALLALGHDISKESLFLTSHILRKFDSETRSKFEHSRDNSKDIPKIDEFISFLEKECDQLEAANLVDVCQQSFSKAPQFTKAPQFSKAKPSPPLAKYSFPKQSNKVSMLTSTVPFVCTFCSSTAHTIYRCPEFSSQSVQSRQAFIKNKGLCNNCFGSHKLMDCKSQRNCSVCSKRHHSMLHITNTPPPPALPATMPKNSSAVPQKPPPGNNNNSNTAPQSNTSTFVGISQGQNNTVLLATALVLLSSNEGYTTVARAVLDSASQTSFISEACANNLKLSRSHAGNNVINGISASEVKTKGFSHLTISSLSGVILSAAHPITILDRITNNLPKALISPDVKLQLTHFVLADPTFDTPGPIDVLIGADLFAHCLKGPPVSLGENMPSTISTIFGNILIGSAPTFTSNTSESALVTLLTVNDLDIHESIKRFWAVEEPPNTIQLSPADKQCEEHFLSTYRRTDKGKYVCRLPFASDPTMLGNSSKHALKMFFILEKKLACQPQTKQLYSTFMNEYLHSGHMELSTTPPSNEPNYYLPHHSVMKDNKIRVVFNASAPTSSNVSLNEILHQGPKLHNEIANIIFYFRLPRIVFTCDIRQMFRHIEIASEDQRFQLIYWRDEPTQPLKVFKLKTVTYGMRSSPFLANKVIQQLIVDEGHNHPIAAHALRDRLYVDDALLGSDTEEDALRLQRDVIQLLQKGGFDLRKWTSNSQVLLDSVSQDFRETPLQFSTSDQPTFNVLGLKWSPQNDVFSYAISTPSQPYTKRAVLSAIARIYDPCGWLTPVILWAKAIMQHLWALGLKWEDKLPDDLSRKWNSFTNELKVLETLEIPRLLDVSNAINVQIHGYCDASTTAYACSVYLRLTDSKGQVSVQLLVAKSRVAPLKQITLPKLELCGAYLLSKLIRFCSDILSTKCKVDSITAWCDSTIVLAWIHTPSYKLKVFVANRVSEIQENTPPRIWQHISSKFNPADCASRGLTPSCLLAHTLWWSGPPWLSSSPSEWPTKPLETIPVNDLPELKRDTSETLVATECNSLPILTECSSWSKLQHVMAYVLRFINCLKKNKTSGPLTLSELKNANNKICYLVQKDNFSEDIKLMKNGKPCSSRIQRLAPFLDSEGIIRVGGRLRNSALSPTAKHPILLPKKHHVINIIIDYFHVQYLHAGPQLLQSTLSQRYWIISARSIIRSRIFKCLRCFRMKPKITAPLMGDLPKGRVIPTRCFSTSGVDYAGPFLVKMHVLKRVQPIKVYICLFICFTTKAVHIEVVTDLTADAFIASLTRFTSRRGLVNHLHSDCGTNFKGAAVKLTKCFQDLYKDPKTRLYAEKNEIIFHFLPPHAPHQGGLWERAVRSAKHHLHRVVGNQILTYEEFTTLTTRIEAMLNSRPIVPLSADPNDLEPLTPGHFLVGGPLTSIVEPELVTTPLNRLRRWQLVQSFAQHIWSRWQQEYLQTLQYRPKWTTHQDNLKIGDLVVVHESNAPPLTWKLGRITGVSPGADGVVRVIQLKTATGTLSRPALKVSRLPLY